MFHQENDIFWPSPEEMGHRHVFLEVAYTTMPMSNFQKKIEPIIKACHVSKFILYTNTRRAVKRETPKLGAWINKNSFKSDILMILGTLQKEHNFYRIQKFTQSNAANAANILQ
jgi:hypothetical protein